MFHPRVLPKKARNMTKTEHSVIGSVQFFSNLSSYNGLNPTWFFHISVEIHLKWGEIPFWTKFFTFIFHLLSKYWRDGPLSTPITGQQLTSNHNYQRKKVDFICLLVISIEFSCDQLRPRRLEVIKFFWEIGKMAFFSPKILSIIWHKNHGSECK